MLGDGVDRSHEIALMGFGRANPRRVAVSRSGLGVLGMAWEVWRGTQRLASFDTHAEAVAYADKQARS